MKGHVDSLFTPDELVAAVKDGLVKGRRHTDLPLTIWNYTQRAVVTRAWNAVTLNCRGLIVDDDGQIVARPWRKFFNVGEHNGQRLDTLDPDAPVEVTDKADGSLGILWRYQGVTGIATRGSFNSEQALHATELLHRRYGRRGVHAPPWLTVLFEIIYPDNRIVLDYSGLDDLILLGAVDRVTGETFGPHHWRLDAWPGPRTQVYGYRSLGQALDAAPRRNAEGLVIRYPATGLMVKAKQDDYVALHRIVTGLNTRAVWEACANGTVEQLLEDLPDEFHAWAIDQAETFTLRFHALVDDATVLYCAIEQRTGLDDRAAFAAEAKKTGPLAPLLFQMLDGRDIAPAIWKSLRPSADITPRASLEQAA